MIAGALHVVVAAKRVSAGSRAHVIAADKQQVRNRGGGIRTLGVLSYSHRPEYAHGLRVGDHVRDCFQSLLGHAGNARGGFHCERLQTLLIFI